MNKYLNSDIFKITLLFLIWRVGLILIMIFAIILVPLGYKDKFLGGGPINYHLSPELFSWANFDGEHYLAIAMFGYKQLEQAFFPIYPALISFFAQPFLSDPPSSLVSSSVVGLLISNTSFLAALLVLYRLVLIDFSKKIALLTIIILLVFPTSFYFGALYNESLFLLLSLLSFYNARKKRWFLASLFGLIASATRVFGFLLLPSLLFEAILQKEKFKNWFWILTIPLGLISYMFFQYINFRDPLAFYNLQTLVGEHRQPGITLLPQVYFRYIKMLLTVDIHNPIYQTIVLEFITGLLFFILPIIGFIKKIRLSYLFYALVSFILPTVQGSLSSVPRYVIVLFPSFLILALLISRLKTKIQVSLFLIFIFFLIIEASLFLRGYWIA